MPLFLPILVTCNTNDELIENNVRINSDKNLEWLKSVKEHDQNAILVGGGASVGDFVEEIKKLKSEGGTIFAMNGASKWLTDKGIEVDFQCIADAKEETSSLVDQKAKRHIIGSQVHPKTMDSVKNPLVWHLGIKDIENLFPEEKVKKGGYVILGGGRSVGNSATCVAFALGFRKLHIFGFDSCHKEGKSHIYDQGMNALIPTIKTIWADREFISSVAMKAQAERFMFTSRHLIKAGCDIKVYGDGLLQTMFNTKYEDLSEREKYQLMWDFDSYRESSPGERVVDLFIDIVNPKGKVIDFGCGTGRAGIKIREKGLDVLLIDFTDNCRDEEAQSIPFIQCDLTKKIPAKSEYGFCTDVMEHIPTKDVETVIRNILNSAKTVFFQISTIEDSMGELIDQPLHLTVKPHSWWRDLFTSLGYEILWNDSNEINALFVVRQEAIC